MRIVAMLMLAGCLLGSAPRAHAKTFVVDQAGGGDCTTIQAAVDSANARHSRDTVIVHAGAYPEYLSLETPYEPDRMICTAGAESTSVLGVTHGGWWGYAWTVEGLTVAGPCTFSSSSHVYWQGCAFLGSFDENHGVPDLVDCDFHGPVSLVGYSHTFQSLRFHHAPLFYAPSTAESDLFDCTFEGSGDDTLVTLQSGGEGVMWTRCRFAGGAVGVNTKFCNGVGYTSCEFEGLGTALYAPNLTLVTNPGLYLDSCRIENCERAAYIRFSYSPPLNWSGHFEMTNCTLIGSEADVASAVDVGEMTGAVGRCGLKLVGNRFEHVGGSAVSASAGWAHVKNNVFFDNAGAGLALTLTSTAYVDSIVGNTFAFNLGDGLAVAGSAGELPSGLAVVRNLAAQNGGDGLQFSSDFGGTLANNDSWQNYGAEFVGSGLYLLNNFSADPMFCDAMNGDLSISAGSPCRPIGSRTVPIGAYGVGCDQELLAAPPSAPALAFAVRPSPARGSVEFALPAGATGARVEVLDAQGRRVWSADVAPGARAVRWQGEAERGGAAGAGIYWARLTGAGGIQAKRFVWLR